MLFFSAAMAFSQLTLPEHWLYPFIELIDERTGIRIREQDYSEFARKLGQRMIKLRIPRPEDYYAHLTGLTDQSRQEWRELTVMITNVESYFFRDHGQFQLLEQVLLPRLIAMKRQERQLRIWSAGCSTGEEPYSLAILLRQLLAHEQGWEYEVLGTDINPMALDRAREGYYPQWSLRSLAPMIRERYFQPCGDGFQLDQRIRKMVRFEAFNLAKPMARQIAIGQIDLIVCRNVFIYFSPDAITTALATFHRALTPHGYLMTGHAELYGQDLAAFQSHLFPESVIYQRRDRQRVKSPVPLPPPVISEPRLRPVPPVVVPVAMPPTAPPPSLADLLTEAEFCLQQKNYRRSRQKIEAVLAQDRRNFAAHLLKAQLEANSGKYEEAIATCQQALKIEPLSIAIYYLMAQIAEEQGDNEGAKQLFKKIIYLEPTAILAYYELSQLYDQEGNPDRGQKMRQTALALLQQLPPQSRVDQRLNLTVEDLIEQIDPANLLSE
ncbi:MAG: chemotaxis protein CheR [Spirulina sp. DLM2.Bin59]|nr:MAG: chemotaxis protein CheR [Spirulina sp. DLM2.Bin59]